jgi:serine protease Do/serine protease DegQ
MALRRTATLLLLLLTLGAGLPAAAALPAAVEGQPLPTLAPMLERVTPAVVNISTESRVLVRDNPLLSDPFFRHFFDLPARPRERTAQSLGSGVIVDAAKGYILTNHHVVDKAVQITVTLNDGRHFSADLVGADPESDVAVIKIPAEGLTQLTVSDSDALRVGDFVVAIGNPFGLGQTVTSGIVSALGRSGLGIEGYEDFIQTDASINPGNSGGALVNLRGELVGLNTAIFSKSGGNMGIGFAIPSNMARVVMEQLLEYGEVQRGLLGVSAQDLTVELAQAFGISSGGGAVVIGITAGSPAEKAGLKVGDVILSLNGARINSAGEMRNNLGLQRPGTRVEMRVWRAGQEFETTAVIVEPTALQQDGGDLDPRLKGAVLDEFTAEDGSSHLRVEDVAGQSPAAALGLRPGDIFLSVNNQTVTDTASLARALQRDPRGILMRLQRGNTLLTLRVR